MAPDLAKIKKETLDIAEQRIEQFKKDGKIHFPEHYSPQNAMKSAWLILQKTQDRSKKPALEVCTRPSIMNALLDMVVQGLNPAKKQGYFIVYGNELVFQRSYFGTMALCKQVTGARDIRAKVVYEKDEFEFEIEDSRTKIINHTSSLTNMNKDEIVGAYCTIVADSSQIITEVMTIEMIKQSWKMSKMNPVSADGKIKADSVHGKFTADMALKTVINRTCKAYINSSDDNSLIIDGQDHFNRSDDVIAEVEVAEEIEEKANAEEIDIQTDPQAQGEVTTTTAEGDNPEWSE